MRTLALLLTGLAAAAGSAMAAGPSPSGSGDVDPSVADGSAQRALDAARRTWRRRGPRSYAYRLQLQCFCTQEGRRPRRFVVRDGRPRHPPKGWKYAATVPRLFKLVQHAIDERPHALRVDYRRNGSLELLSVDPKELTIDEEYAYFVDRFRRLR